LRPTLEHLIGELGLEDIVRLPGRVVGDAVLDCYARADVFALFCVEASDGDRDGIPNTMIEAMAMEIPVVSTRYTGVPELVGDGTTGILTDCGDRRRWPRRSLLLSRRDIRKPWAARGVRASWRTLRPA